ncbi:phosphatidylinositol-specific phospholipase C domain-containing protein [Chimaeribacter californicus]|uniref:phosphatidylinositol-specific phospholipase C domain-containing protein n=1 Tax=Chimaeribacter californicus TaxID=2060067 RepID=UPI0013FD0AEB|nr:phosphatidylinositol-specific phospholipase C domain-containing protein [Chimaeribacter californicus]
MNKFTLLAIPLLAMLCGTAQAHKDDGYSHDTNYMDYSRTRWMSDIDDSTPLGRLSIPGTHDSGSRYGGAAIANQVMTISQQLNAGIRYLDIRVRHIDNHFAIHHGPVYQHLNFDDVLSQTAAFLAANPTEIVFMRIKEEHKPTDNTRTINETLDEYLQKYSKAFKFPRSITWNKPLTLGEMRGKIVVIYDGLSGNAQGYNFGNIPKQDDYHMKTNWSQYSKWEKIKEFINAANTNGDITLNHLSGSGGSFPYFVASGHSSADTSAGRLATGLTTPGWKHRYPDFPRVSCFIGICTIAFEGTNTLTKNYLNNNDNITDTGIIAADFPGKGLIQSVIQKNNFVKQQLKLKSTGQCAAAEGDKANKQGANAIVEKCGQPVPDKQFLRLENDQLMLGDKCLDVKDHSNRDNAPVIFWACNQGNNQKWSGDRGRLRSWLPGTQRCLTLGNDKRSLILRSCYAPGADQIFSLVKSNSPVATTSGQNDDDTPVMPTFTDAPEEIISAAQSIPYNYLSIIHGVPEQVQPAPVKPTTFKPTTSGVKF